MKALLLLTALTVMLAQKTSGTEQFQQSASNLSHDEKACSSDSVFNKVLQICDKDGAKRNFKKENIEERSICIDGNIKQSTDDTGYLICIGNVWRKRLCPAEHVFSAVKVACIPGSSEDGCTPGMIRPHPSNNKKFYICMDNEWRVHSCPDAKFFDKRISICVKTKKKIDSVPGECNEGCVHQDSECCEKFYVCEDGKWKRRSCPSSKYFDPQHKACVIDLFGYCRKTTPKPSPKCEDGCTKQDPNCCERYLECVHGEWVQRPCPKGLYFDSSKQTCIVDVNGVCIIHPTTTKPIECPDGRVKQDTECCDKFYCCENGEWSRRSCPSDQYFDPRHQACINDVFGFCRKTTPKPRPKCEDGCVKQNPNSCKKYLECVHGEWIQRPCPNGLYFNPSQQACIHDVLGVCITNSTNLKPLECIEGCVKQDRECGDKFYSCENGKWIRRSCPFGQYFNPQQQACVTDVFDECQETTPQPRPKCEDGYIKQDPNCCEKYLECVQGEWVQRPCPKGLYFDSIKQTCIVDVKDVCITHMTTPKPVECTDGRVKQDTECCDKFYCCENSKWSRRSCPSGQYFDPQHQACVLDVFGYCRKTTPRPRPKCENGCVKKDPSCCDKYLECVHGEWMQRQCPKGLSFDSSKQACALDILGGCIKNHTTPKLVECTEGCFKQDRDCCEKFYSCENGIWNQRSCPSDQYFDPYSNACVADLFNFCRNRKCENGRVKQGPNSCDKYLECVHGDWIQRPCPNGLYFDPNKGACMYDTMGVCIKNSTMQKPDQCIDGCVKQDSDCCDKFYSCENSKWIRRPCPSGQYFDPQRQICVIDEFGYCRKTTPKPRPKCDDRCVKQDPNCCAKYFQCVHGEWVQRPCPKGLYFDPRKQACVVDVLGVCRKY